MNWNRLTITRMKIVEYQAKLADYGVCIAIVIGVFVNRNKINTIVKTQ